jgi:hypothetical protein
MEDMKNKECFIGKFKIVDGCFKKIRKLNLNRINMLLGNDSK